ncbi:MAG: metallophosphoesterase [Allorhizobium sp.]
MTSELPRLKLGIIADPQYADLDPDPKLDRHFRRSLDKLKAAVEHFNTRSLDVVVVLGDLIDRGFENFGPVLAVLDELHAPRILLPGNHDFLVEPQHLPHIHTTLGMPAPYHEVQLRGLRLVVIDGNEISVFAPPEGDARRIEAEARLAALKAEGAANAQDWNAGVSGQQAAWIADRLSTAERNGEHVILLGHYPIYPPSDHTLWNAEALASVIASSAASIAYLCGHHHAGNHAEREGVHFVNFCGMVDTEHQNAFAVLSVFDDRIVIEGHGREPSRRLMLAPAKRHKRHVSDNSLTAG